MHYIRGISGVLDYSLYIPCSTKSTPASYDIARCLKPAAALPKMTVTHPVTTAEKKTAVKRPSTQPYEKRLCFREAAKAAAKKIATNLSAKKVEPIK